GNNIVQAFHERLASRRSRSSALLKDIVAFSNTNGGTLFVGLDANPEAEIVGVPRAKNAAEAIRADVARFITPPPTLTVEVHSTDDKDILVINVPQGREKPYAL